MVSDSSPCEVKFETLSLDNVDFQIRSLKDRQQFDDPEGIAEEMGISSAHWSLFGIVWPSALVLTDAMVRFDTDGKRVLEIGCGLALASLSMHSREVDITASDYHPMVESFLKANLKLNDLPPMPFQKGNWVTENPLLGKFDVIIGSDVLYEQAHPDMLSAFIDRHAESNAEICIVDPGRGHHNKFNRAMETLGYTCSTEYLPVQTIQGKTYRGKLLHCDR
jgi:2-polyprenyl-3-methyl-5-hydroxy-6-metoxy-1,4-benzoquinol methylase